MRKVVLISIIPVFFLLGCCSITGGRNQAVRFVTIPPGATVSVNGEPKGITPVRLTLNTKRTYGVQYNKEGYRSEKIQIRRHFRFPKWFFGNLLFSYGAPLGIFIDGVSSAAYSLCQIPRGNITLSSITGIKEEEDPANIDQSTTH